MAVESKRGCGYRKIGGLYLVGDPGEHFSCDRLPIPLLTCPTCGEGIKPTRGWTWVFPHNLFQGVHSVLKCSCPPLCPICFPDLMGRKAGLTWIGTQFYTPSTFAKEALTLGVSRRISSVPRGLVLGKTWVLVGHRQAAKIPAPGTVTGEKPCPGIFYAFIPQRMEMIITESYSEDEKFMEKLEKRGITPVVVPADDKDHR